MGLNVHRIDHFFYFSHVPFGEKYSRGHLTTFSTTWLTYSLSRIFPKPKPCALEGRPLVSLCMLAMKQSAATVKRGYASMSLG